MKVKDVPKSPAYLVYHDAYMNGAMDIYPYPDFASAQAKADQHNETMDEMGVDGAGLYRAYVKLPRKKVWKYHAAVPREMV